MDTLNLARFDRALVLSSGERVRLRPIRPDDEPRLSDLYDRSSRETRYHRFFTVLRRLPTDWARFLANVDYDRRFALVVEDLAAPATSLIGVARYEPAELGVAEIAFVVEDRWQRKGLGTLLITELFRAAAENGIARFRAWVLAENRRMLDLLVRHADVVERRMEQGVVELLLTPKGYRPRTVSTGL
jgi:RimJ/RimL family protein N-acetyltransferase